MCKIWSSLTARRTFQRESIMFNLHLNQLPGWLFSHSDIAHGKFNPANQQNMSLSTRKKKHIFLVMYPEFRVPEIKTSLEQAGFKVEWIINDADFSREALWNEAHERGLNRKDCVTIGINDSLEDLKRYIALDPSFLSQKERCVFVIQTVCKNLENSSASIDVVHYLMTSYSDEAFEIYSQSLIPLYLGLIIKRHELLENSLNFIINANSTTLKMNFFFELMEKAANLGAPKSIVLQVSKILQSILEKFKKTILDRMISGEYSRIYVYEALSREAIASLANSLTPYLAHSQAPEKNIVYGGVELGHTLSSAITSTPTSLDLIAHFNYISPGQRPLWLNNLARMSLGTLFTYDGREFKEIKTTLSPTAIQPLTCHEMY